MSVVSNLNVNIKPLAKTNLFHPQEILTDPNPFPKQCPNHFAFPTFLKQNQQLLDSSKRSQKAKNNSLTPLLNIQDMQSKNESYMLCARITFLQCFNNKQQGGSEKTPFCSMFSFNVRVHTLKLIS